MTVRGLRRHLARLDLEPAAEAALAAQAGAIVEAARAAGADDGEAQVAGSEALVGWRSAALRRRERGDAGVPPQPVLGPVAATHGALAAEAVAAAGVDALRGG